MLDDYTLNVSFLGGFLVVAAFFVSPYFSLGNDPGVRPLIVIYAIPKQSYTFPALRHPNYRVLSPDSLVFLSCAIYL